jgi:signal transduction histidine kinase
LQRLSPLLLRTRLRAARNGLGLALCKKFVEMHGGTIGADSIFGTGAAFWFILPAEGPVRRAS